MPSARVHSPIVAVRDDFIKALQRDERSIYEICRQSGVPQSSLSRFIHGKSGLSFESLEAIAKILGLELRVVRRRPRRRAAKKSK